MPQRIPTRLAITAPKALIDRLINGAKAQAIIPFMRKTQETARPGMKSNSKEQVTCSR